jgi:2'-5' RNA ligase
MPDDAGQPPKIRSFLAVELTPELRAKIADLLGRLQKGAQFTGAHPVWVKPENVHLTLKFLGQTDDAQRLAVTAAMRAAARRHGPHVVRIKGLGVFPSERAPRVLWVAVKRCDPLLALQRDVEAAVEPLGWPPEGRAFSPHLTLARIKSQRRSQALMSVVESHSRWEIGDWPIREVVLFQSMLHPSGSIYTLLERFPLTGAVA